MEEEGEGGGQGGGGAALTGWDSRALAGVHPQPAAAASGVVWLGLLPAAWQGRGRWRLLWWCLWRLKTMAMVVFESEP